MARIIFHVGVPKTGSSAIQAFLTLNREIAKNKGVDFPNPPPFKQAYQTSLGNAYVLTKQFLNNEARKIDESIRAIDVNQDTILSSENFFHVLRACPKRFFEKFKFYELLIVCYVRRQDNWIPSCYKQLVKNHNFTGKLDWNFISKHPDFCSILLSCLDYIAPSQIVLRCYEKGQLRGGDILQDFLSCIGLEWDDRFLKPSAVVNPSLGVVPLEFRRILNILEVDSGDDSRKRLINEILTNYTVLQRECKPFGDDNLLSPEERRRVIELYQERNEKLAEIFLRRQNLFCDPLPTDDGSYEREELSVERVAEICSFMRRDEYGVEKGVIDQIEDQVITYLLGERSKE